MEEIKDKLEEIEEKLDKTISQLQTSSYANEMKVKKMMESWLGVLYNEFKKETKKLKSDFESELKKTKQELIKEIKNGIKR